MPPAGVPDLPDPLERLTPAELRCRTRKKWREHPPDVLPLWVAEMDVLLAGPVQRVPVGHRLRRGAGVLRAPGRWAWGDLDVARTAQVPDATLGSSTCSRCSPRPATQSRELPGLPTVLRLPREPGRQVVEAPRPARRRAGRRRRPRPAARGRQPRPEPPRGARPHRGARRARAVAGRAARRPRRRAAAAAGAARRAPAGVDAHGDRQGGRLGRPPPPAVRPASTRPSRSPSPRCPPSASPACSSRSTPSPCSTDPRPPAGHRVTAATTCA